MRVGKNYWDFSTECKFNGISNEVEQHLLEPLLITEYLVWNPIRHLQSELETLLQYLELHDVKDLPHSRAEIEGVLEERELVVFKATHVKCILNQTLQMQGRVLYNRKELLYPLVLIRIRGHYIKYHPHDWYDWVQWSPEFVGHWGEECGTELLPLQFNLLEFSDVATDGNNLATIINYRRLHLDKPI